MRTIDLFAGAGGFSTGARMAGCNVVWAANHWQSAVIGTITTRDRHAIIDGDRMRMLSVPEARAAMSFPKDYKLPTQSRLAMHMLGNAVAPLAACDVIAAVQQAI